jgi:hypothetical protein
MRRSFVTSLGWGRAAFLGFAIVCVASAPMSAMAETRSFSFEGDTVGAPPVGFAFSHALKRGSPGAWSVIADDTGRGKILAQIDADKTLARFPTAIAPAIVAADVDLSVRYRPVAGMVDMAAGLVWRYQDADNYYVVRANALENNVVLYKVEKGRRIDLPLKGLGQTYGAKSPVPKGQWSTLRVVAEGPLFTVHNNGVELYQVEDLTFVAPGKVGVWTKADSVTHFDDLIVVTK